MRSFARFPNEGARCDALACAAGRRGERKSGYSRGPFAREFLGLTTQGLTQGRACNRGGGFVIFHGNRVENSVRIWRLRWYFHFSIFYSQQTATRTLYSDDLGAVGERATRLLRCSGSKEQPTKTPPLPTPTPPAPTSLTRQFPGPASWTPTCAARPSSSRACTARWRPRLEATFASESPAPATPSSPR